MRESHGRERIIAAQKEILRRNPGASTLLEVHVTKEAAEQAVARFARGQRPGWNPGRHYAYWDRSLSGAWEVCVRELTEREVRAVSEMRAAGLLPRSPYPGPEGRWSYDCLLCESSSSTTLTNVRRGTRCYYCKGDPQVLDHIRMRAAERIEVMRAAGLEPVEPFLAGSVPWACRCLHCGKVSSVRLDVVKEGGRCRFCRGGQPKKASSALRRVVRAAARRETRRVAQAARSVVTADVLFDAGFDPLEDFPGASSGWLCACLRCGFVQTVSFRQVVKMGNLLCNGCTAVNLALRSGLRPLVTYSGSPSEPWASVCVFCGRESSPCLDDMKSRDTACGFCRGGLRGPREEGGAVEFEEVADSIRRAALAGDYPEGRLPGPGELAGRYGCTEGTVRRALALLKKERFVHSTHAGTFVGPAVPGSGVWDVRCRTCGEVFMAPLVPFVGLLALLGEGGWGADSSLRGWVFGCPLHPLEG